MNAADLAKQASYPAPAMERIQARAELEKTFLPTRSDFPPMSDVQKLVNLVHMAWEHDEFLKSQRPVSATPSKRTGPQPVAVYIDQFGVFGSVPGGYRLRPSTFGAEQLRMMVEHTPLINAIILRRQRTIGRFLRPVERNRDIYFEVRRNDEAGTIKPRKGPTETALEQFLIHSGWDRDPARMTDTKRDSLTAFVAKSLRDILTLDAWAIETVRTRNGKTLASFHAVDAGTIFLASEQGYDGNDAIRTVQIVNGVPARGFTADDMIYAVQNPRTDIRHYGYGYPPPEMIVRIVTGYLNALTYNLRGFDSNSIPKGLLTIFGNFDQTQLTFFKQQWNAMVRGVNNAWALPVLVSEGQEAKAQFEKFGVEFNEMYFAKWMVLLTAIICAVYGMDPAEIYSENFSAGRSPLSGRDTAERLADARDTGLEPLLTFIEDVFSTHLIGRVEPDYIFRFIGLHPTDQERQHEVDKLVLTRNQLAEKYGYETVNEAWGDAPLNPVLQQAWLAGQGGWQGPASDGPGAPGETTEPVVEEHGDREGADATPPEPTVEEAGDRDLSQPDDGPGRERPEGAERERRPRGGPDEPSTMMRKAIAGDVLVVG